ncbi:FAD/NADP-binding domain-containing protein [Gigaspora margarita]|uniref:FAD/NADP-binding domain-containing protein n=1 Tax=Gigaspora margarita TaxID=4874 RepID=A0A8H3X8U6_GIGMA|nr:FAD/NADP-binding domain-containing protein [Gigaspora margarita]
MMTTEDNDDKQYKTILIIGAGPGGLCLAHSLLKHNEEKGKKFKVKVFERDSSPTDRWQGYHITLQPTGVRSLLNCTPKSLHSKLREIAIPDPIKKLEDNTFSIVDQYGKLLFATPNLQTKNIFEFSEIKYEPTTPVISYRDRIRDVLLEGIDVTWGKKCIGYEEVEQGVWALFEDGTKEFGEILVGCDGIHSNVRKQKLPNLKINNLGLTIVAADIAPTKKQIDRLFSISGGSLCKLLLGTKGDLIMYQMRYLPIQSKTNLSNKDDDYTHYRLTITYSYNSLPEDEVDKLTYRDDESPESRFPNEEEPKDIINNVKEKLREYRPNNELTDLIIELWSLVPTTDDSTIYYPFNTYHKPRRRPLRVIDPCSIEKWPTTRVTLLGDSIHAMSPWPGLGTNIAMKDAYELSQSLFKWSEEENKVAGNDWRSCIESYEKEMRLYGSEATLISINETLKLHVRYNSKFGVFIRNITYKIMHIIYKLVYLFKKVKKT